MKKICFIIIFLYSTSFCSAITLSEPNNINIIINSDKKHFDKNIILYNNCTLVPLREICTIFGISDNEISFKNNIIAVKKNNNNLTLKINSKTAYINSSEVSISVPPILYKNTTYIPLRIISEFFDCVVHWNEQSKSIFIKNSYEYEQIASFFSKIEKKLAEIKILRIDTINEVFSDNNLLYSFGDSIYIDKNMQKIFYKNVLSDKWNYNILKASSQNTPSFNQILFSGIDFNKSLSDENFMIFTGLYPLKSGELCKTSLYINTSSLLLEKQITEFSLNNNVIRQQILYSTEL